MAPLQMNVYDDESTSHATLTPSPVSKRRLHFSEFNEVFHIPHIKDMDKEEIRNIWSETSDFKGIKREIMDILEEVSEGRPVKETNSQSMRGIEIRTHEGAVIRKRNKRESRSAVMGEQRRQYERGEQDEELLAMVYRMTSSRCQFEARRLGLQDEAVLKTELETMRRISHFQGWTSSSSLRQLTRLFRKVGLDRVSPPEDD
jgi:hypothetical protein